ncbi:non-homologous end-joining DNA ligase [Streptomyces sp. RFCAC02]|uniref:non-homologous end-joining DNA ligase n=1 Tax=Streptomyces sp. RFCAC02 TaxID=2499143 RepID=UPI0023EA60D7|nr:non-homologous end-joining DNA ligase [Streptomyces sp. RFCAC02]
MSGRQRERIRVAGRDVPLSRPDKPMFPDDGITKAELVDYYRSVARPMLTYTRGRPVSMERYPDGYTGHSFFHKDVPRHFPDWVHRAEVPKAGGSLTMAVCDDAPTLAYLAGQACITPHIWLSRADRPDCPDRMVIDLDPPEGGGADADFATVRWAATAVRDLLADLGLKSVVMTTGSRGLHVLVPLDGKSDVDTVRAFARDAAGVLAARHPDRLTTEVRKDRRKGRLYLDTQRNGFAQTAVAPYAVRARRHAPVATPLTWDEVDDPDLGPRNWTLRTLPGRLAERGDPWAGLHRLRRSLRPAQRRLTRLTTAPPRA